MKLTTARLKKLIREELDKEKMRIQKEEFKQIFDVKHLESLEKEEPEYKNSNLYKSSLNQIVKYYSQMPEYLESLLKGMEQQLIKMPAYGYAGFDDYYNDYKKAIENAKSGVKGYKPPKGVGF